MKLRFAAMVCFLTLALGASAQMQFSADTTTKKPKMGPIPGKMYLGGNKMRMDTTQQGHSSIMIVDLQRKVADVLMPQQQMYMEMNFTQYSKQMPDIRAYDPNRPCATDTGATCRKVGTDVVNGRVCDKWEFSGGAAGKRTVWVDQKNHLPIRTVSSDGSTFEMTNIKEGPQPATLFAIPPGYRKMNMGAMTKSRH